MLKNRIAKITGLTVGMTLVLGLSVSTAGAQTIAELQAQINALMAQLASLQGGSTVSTGTTFTMNLTIGSTGSEVVALQQVLVAQGHLVMPTGVAMGYFGPLTRAAVAQWQAANGVAPAAGYWGPISRAKYNSMSGGTVPGGTVGTGTSGTIGTPGVEGVLTVTTAPTPSSGQTLNEGDTREAVFGIELEADLSDIRIERIKIKLDDTTNGNDRDFYRDIANTLYVMHGSTVLASVDLNSDTVIEETNNEYFVTITGVNFVVRKDTTETLTLAVDIEDSIDSTLLNGDVWTVTVPIDGVRGVDGAGINQFSPSAAIARTFTVEADATETATLTISTNSNTPKATEVIANESSTEDELDELEILRFDVEADDDDVTITDVVVDVTTTGAATTTTGYLYHGSTLLASDSVDTDGHAGFTFDDVDFVVDDGDTETLIVKVDVVDAALTETTIVADVDTADVTAENSEGDSITESGSATGETISIRKSGLEVSLVSSSVAYTASSPVVGATSTAKATFVLKLEAIGTDLYFGTQAASSTFAITTFVGGVETAHANSSSTSFVIPSSGVVTTSIGGSNAFLLQEDNSVNVTVETIFPGRLDTGAFVPINAYAFGVDAVQWSRDGITAPNTSDFMAGRTEWRTSSVTLP